MKEKITNFTFDTFSFTLCSSVPRCTTTTIAIPNILAHPAVQTWRGTARFDWEKKRNMYIKLIDKFANLINDLTKFSNYKKYKQWSAGDS
jgi:hypothetical protein